MTFLAQIDTVGPFVIGACIGAVACAVPHLRRRYHQWRLARRRQHNPYMQLDELREYQLAIGGELPPVDPAKLAHAALFVGLALAIPLWAAGTVIEMLWEYEWLIVSAVGGLYLLWRWFNDPPELRAEAGIPDVSVPREAWLGLVGGITGVALILLFIAALV